MYYLPYFVTIIYVHLFLLVRRKSKKKNTILHYYVEKYFPINFFSL